MSRILDKIKEGEVRWFRYVKRREETTTVRVVETFIVEEMRSRGRPKLTWNDRIMHDLVELHISEDMIQDRSTKTSD